MLLRELRQRLEQRLHAILPQEPQEVRAHQRLLLEEAYGVPLYRLVLRAEETVPAEAAERIEGWMQGLEAGMPLQYAMGRAYFFDRPFTVDPSVLIPRRETEELTRLAIVRLMQSKESMISGSCLRVADLGCGSGSIAITLDLEVPAPLELYAVDLSADALRRARENAESLGASRCRFIPLDLLAAERLTPAIPTGLDMIVSNPPYIPLGERERMPSNVVQWEPPVALFVPDDDPLRFYTRIARLARGSLRPGGQLLFECHSAHAERVASMLEREGFLDARSQTDAQGLPRFATAEMPRDGKS